MAIELGGCGGADQGRPSGQAPGRLLDVDQCELAARFELQTIIDFEPKEQPNGFKSYKAVCDPFFSGCSTDPVYFNFDTAHTIIHEIRTPADLPSGVSDASQCVRLAPLTGSFDTPTSNVTGTALPANLIRPCGSSQTALHIAEENASMCHTAAGRLGWGASLDITLEDSGFFDASAWDGVALWVRRTDTSQVSLILSVVDQNTLGVDSVESGDTIDHCGCRLSPTPSDPRRIVCSSDPGPEYADTQKCDPFGIAITLTDQWTFVPAYFSAMRQKGFGVTSSLGHLETRHVKRIQLLMTAGDWDFWLDDVVLFKQMQQR